MARAPALSVPDTQQRFQLRIADQPLGITAVKQTSGVGRPDPRASWVFQPLRQGSERRVIHCQWAQSRLTCCVHVYTYSWARERLIYVVIVTERSDRTVRVNSLKTIQNICHFDRPEAAAKKGPSYDGPFCTALYQRLTGAGCCWVRQWMLPPPSSSSRPGIITTSWSGKTLARIALAWASAGSSKLGAMMPPLTIRKFT